MTLKLLGKFVCRRRSHVSQRFTSSRQDLIEFSKNASTFLIKKKEKKTIITISIGRGSDKLGFYWANSTQTRSPT